MEAKIIRKYNKKRYSQLHERAKFYFKKFIRLRDTDDLGYGRCISSGQPLKYGTEDCQAGHYFSAGDYKILEFNEDNVNLQGKSDNYYKSGAGPIYRINLVKKIGVERVEELEKIVLISKRDPFKEDRFLMIEIIEKYKVKVKKLAKTNMVKA
jgi:hypothetical protein